MPISVTTITTSATQTKQFAKTFARSFASPCLILLEGDLGAGKTTFVSGFVQGLRGGSKVRVQSPTYALARSYATKPTLHHIDLYRLSETEMAIDLGIEHLIEDEEAFVIVEWPERLPHQRFINAISVELQQGDKPNTRVITVNR